MTRLLEQFVKVQNAIAGLGQRMREQEGQTTVEWLVIAVGITGLVAALTAANVWDGAAKAIANEFKSIVQSVLGD
jgi:hypothetical protein